MIASYVGLAFFEGFHIVLYVSYIISAVNLCFCFKRDKHLFILTGVVFVGLTIAPLKTPAVYVDSLLLATLVSMFQVRGRILHSVQTEYGLLQVHYNQLSNRLTLINDRIYHGEKYYDEDEHTHVSYYGDPTKGPMATIFGLLPEEEHLKIGILGLGVGVMARFGKVGQELTFYDINSEVIRIAQEPGLFGYLDQSEAKVNVILGDARDKLAEAKNHYYDMICMDIYLGSKVPTRFLTLEAMQLYLQKLKHTGILAIHTICASHDNLDDMIASMAAKLNLFAYSYKQNFVMNRDDVFQPSGRGVRAAPFQFFSSIEKRYKVPLTCFFKKSYEDRYSWVVLSQRELETPAECLNTDNPYAPRWSKLKGTEQEDIYTDEAIAESVYS
jgi:spermidine synthase